MPRLPIPGGDESYWGDILNDYLEQIHTPIGGLKANTVNTAQLANGSITAEKLAAATAPTTGQQLTYNGTALHWQTPTTPATPEVIPTDAQIIVASDAPASWQALKATKATASSVKMPWATPAAISSLKTCCDKLMQEHLRLGLCSSTVPVRT